MKKKPDYKITSQVACIILAGGKGTRLSPLTLERCKPAVNFGGRYRLIDVPISNSLNSRMNHIFVISQYFSSSLNEHIKNTFPLDHFQGGSLNLLCPEERPDGKIWYEGTADAVRKNLEAFEKLPIEYFLILSGDQLYNMDLELMVQQAFEADADLTIASLPVGQNEASRYGLLNVNSKGSITDFVEKPSDTNTLKNFEVPETFLEQYDLRTSNPPSYLASMGIYVFKKRTLIDLLKTNPGNDFGKDLIPYQLKRGKSLAFIYQGYWEDIGTIKSYYEANLSLTTNDLGLDLYNEVLPIYAHNHYLPGARLTDTQIINTIICDGTIIDAKEIRNSIIGVRSIIKRNTTISDSLLLGNTSYNSTLDPTIEYTIGENCQIHKAIIDQNVIIGDNVKLVNRDNLETYDSKEITIRNGIIVIKKGSKIPNGFVL